MGRAMLAVVMVLMLAACGSDSAAGSPSQTISTFLRAAAAGDGAKTCAQLSPAARRQVVTGTSCEQGIKLLAPLLHLAIARIKIENLHVRGDTATGISVLNGQQIASFELSRKSGRWLITNELNTTHQTSSAPSSARVKQVATCLEKRFTVENAGLESVGGPHVVLSVDLHGLTVAMVNVFEVAGAARSAQSAIAASTLRHAVVSGRAVVVYLRQLSATDRKAIESCG